MGLDRNNCKYLSDLRVIQTKKFHLYLLHSTRLHSVSPQYCDEIKLHGMERLRDFPPRSRLALWKESHWRGNH